MDLTHRFLAGLPLNIFTTLLLYLLGVLTLVFSMIISSRLAGGIDFGAAKHVVLKGGGLLAVVTAIQFFNFGILLAGPVWFLGLMFLFSLDYRETRILTRLNWGMNGVWKLLLLLWML